MSRHAAQFVAASLIVVIALLVIDVDAVDAADPEGLMIQLVAVQPEVMIGERAELQAQVYLVNNGVETPVRGASVTFLINDLPVGDDRTSADGVATYLTSRELTAGTHTITGTIEDSSARAGATATTDVTVKPWLLQVQTFPAVEGVTFSLNGERFNSGSDGMAQLDVQKAGEYQLRFESSEAVHPSMKIEFQRWNNNFFEPFLDIRVPSSRVFQAGLVLRRHVTFDFVDPQGNAVPVERSSSMAIRSNVGTLYEFAPSEAQWIEAYLVAPRSRGRIEAVPVTYAVQNVIVDGANVVNQSQQRFDVPEAPVWRIELLLFSAQFVARDALFGFPIGSGFILEFPDGDIEHFRSDRNANATVHALARGLYDVRVADAPGIAPTTPVAIVRDQDVTLKVITYFDMALVGLVSSAVAVSLIAIGRPQLLKTIHQRTRWRPDLPRAISLGAFGLTIMICGGFALLIISYLLTVDSTVAPDGLAVGQITQRPAGDGDASSAPAATEQAPAVSGTPEPSASIKPEGESDAGDNDVVSPEVTPGVTSRFVIDDRFLEFWQTNGGASLFGEPVSNLFYDVTTGYWSQVFEYATLEHHPLQRNTLDQVQLRLLGTIDARRRGLTESHEAFVGRPSDSTALGACTFFAATEHKVCSPFREYWEQHGLDFGETGTSYRESMALFGYPLSEQFVDPDTGQTVQYFQRARLEYAPEGSDSVQPAPVGFLFIHGETVVN